MIGKISQLHSGTFAYVKLQYSCETSSQDLDVWLQPPDILTNNSSEPCLEDAKGDGKGVEQVI